MRCADAVPLPLLGALPALWKGLLYDDAARETGAALLPLGAEDLSILHVDVSRRGLSADAPSGPILDLARALARIARDGLERQGPTGRAETSLLDPLDELLERGKSPGEIVLERWEGDWDGSPDRLIDATRY
jgi:glutamate--cysteine ligase